MKKFQFSLEKLSNYKEQVLKKEKNELARLRKQQQKYIDDKIKLINCLEQTNQQFNREKDFTPQKMAVHKNYMASLNEQIMQCINFIEKFEKKIETQLQVVISATKEVNTLDKLKEKQLEEYQKAQIKENELFIEEFVSNTSFKKAN